MRDENKIQGRQTSKNFDTPLRFINSKELFARQIISFNRRCSRLNAPFAGDRPFVYFVISVILLPDRTLFYLTYLNVSDFPIEVETCFISSIRVFSPLKITAEKKEGERKKTKTLFLIQFFL